MSRFDDVEKVRVFTERGEYPRIHDHIVELIESKTPLDASCVDLGACTGLLAKQLVGRCKKSFVLAVEGNRKYLDMAVCDERIQYLNAFVTMGTMDTILDSCAKNGVTLMVARRVFPEIAEQGVEVVRMLAEKSIDAGIRRIVLEGGVKTRNPRNPLHSAELECEALSEHYRVIYCHHNCRMLEAVKGA